ncbi:hypothetical protein J2X65_003411 [Ancylobacter sp. 3268]|nr:hypothetical protein [Ancylobacter sp. 3268]MDR6954044.1 hypothetical protein [Ancylobacter sp. 3268]
MVDLPEPEEPRIDHHRFSGGRVAGAQAIDDGLMFFAGGQRLGRVMGPDPQMGLDGDVQRHDLAQQLRPFGERTDRFVKLAVTCDPILPAGA